MIGWKLSKTLLVNPSRYSFALFKSTKPQNQNRDRRIFMTKDKDNKQILFTPEDAKKVNEVNQYFQGIRYNTSYAKFYNEDSRNQQTNLTAKNASDLPFQGTSNQIHQSDPSMSQLAEKLFSKIPGEKLDAKITEICSGYFTDLLKGENKIKIQPNFEREGRRTILSLMKQGWNFQMGKMKQSLKYSISKVEVIKGVEVIRNNNYTTDSYSVIEEDGYIFYKLVQKSNQKLPEEEWFRQRNTILKIVVNVEAPSVIKASRKNQELFSNQNKQTHVFTLEMDLRRPPQFSQFSLSPIDYLGAYRPNLSELTITDVDKRNIYTAYTYDEQQKKHKLINKLK